MTPAAQYKNLKNTDITYTLRSIIYQLNQSQHERRLQVDLVIRVPGKLSPGACGQYEMARLNVGGSIK